MKRKAKTRSGSKTTAKERALIAAGKKLAIAGAAPVALLMNPNMRKWMHHSDRLPREMLLLPAQQVSDKTKTEIRKVLEHRKQNPKGCKGRSRNPQASAVAAFEDFHGYTPKQILEFTTQYHYHEFTWAVGKLISMVIRTPKNQGSWDVTLKNFKGALLTANEKPNGAKTPTQLFVEGGDQSIDLETFGIKDEHELQYLGEWMDVVYFARKDHLGDDGGVANYEHKFGTKELTFSWRKKVARPHIVYDVRNEQLMIAGGGYDIPSEGIDG